MLPAWLQKSRLDMQKSILDETGLSSGEPSTNLVRRGVPRAEEGSCLATMQKINRNEGCRGPVRSERPTSAGVAIGRSIRRSCAAASPSTRPQFQEHYAYNEHFRASAGIAPEAI
jgi:hypothetical protein